MVVGAPCATCRGSGLNNQNLTFEARLAYTGTTSINISVEVRSGDLKAGVMEKITECLVVFVSVDPDGRPVPVSAYFPGTPGEMALAERVRAHLTASRAADFPIKAP